MVSGLYDTHFHLDLFEEPERLISSIERKKIYTIAVTNLPFLYKRFISRYDSKYIKPAIGFHPELVSPKYMNQMPYLLEMINGVKYIGEIGIDLTRN